MWRYGFKYTSHENKAICESKGIQISMSRKGTPIDDSPIESRHALLKKETLYNNNITSLQEYIDLVEDWIKFYNNTRLKNTKNIYFFVFFITIFFLISTKWGSLQNSSVFLFRLATSSNLSNY